MPDGTRRDKPAFEPPPWERDAFDELARKRAEEEERQRVASAEAEAARTWAEQARAAAEAAAEPAESPAKGDVTPEGRPSGTEGGAAGVEQRGPAAAPQRELPAIDDRKVDAMLVELAVQEPNLGRSVRPLGMWASIVTGAVGVVMFGVSIYFTLRAAGNAIGMMGGVIIGVLGAFFIGVAFWMWVRATRGKGS